MTTQQFIEKAIEGGWTWYGSADFKPYDERQWLFHRSTRYCVEVVSTEQIILDPEAWKAVGKVEGWKEKVEELHGAFPRVAEEWRWNMHRMIDALVEGKRVEEFLATL